MTAATKAAILDAYGKRFRLAPIELLPWIAAGILYVLAPQYMTLGAQIIVMTIFVLSLDLLVGYAGIVTLGHAAFYGAGAYAAGIFSASFGHNEPISGLLVGTLVAGALGLACGFLVLRTRGLTLLILSLSFLLLLQEAANQAFSWTGGADGLSGISTDPLLGRFAFGMDGRTTYLYALAVLFLCWALVRYLLATPFGRSIVGIRENARRMGALGVDVRRREHAVFTLSAAMAGLAGALSAQVDQFVSLNVLSFELSGTVLVVLALGGVGRLYGAFVGAPIFLVAQDVLSKDNPVFWNFWLGLLLVLVVLFARGGLLGLAARLVERVRTARGAGRGEVG